MRRILLLLTLLSCSYRPGVFAYVPTPDHVVICILENHGYGEIVGSSAAPYINSLLADSFCALFTQSYALTHPSQPNYLQLFSGSTQGVTDDNVPANLPFITANLGAELIAAGRTFKGYSEDLPSVGYTGATSGAYARKHNPWVNWQGTSANGIPSADNQPLTAFPTSYSSLPTLSFVIPNQNNDMHNGTDPTRITTADTWVQTHLDGYIQWAKTHNSLCIITFDEDDNSASNQILTFFLGQMVKKGSYSTHVDHYGVLRTLEDMYSLSHAGNAATAPTIDYVWNYSTLNLTCFLEGFYRGSGTMVANLYNLGLSTDAAVVDTVEVNLWSPANLGNSIPNYSIKTILHKNGTAAALFPVTALGNNYYIAVKHRNSIETWSAAAMSFTATVTYNFSTGQSTAYSNGINVPMKNKNGVYAFYGGDSNQDGTVDVSDMSAWDNDASVFAYGYHATDIDGNGATDAADVSIMDNNARLTLYYARP